MIPQTLLGITLFLVTSLVWFYIGHTSFREELCLVQRKNFLLSSKKNGYLNAHISASRVETVNLWGTRGIVGFLTVAFLTVFYGQTSGLTSFHAVSFMIFAGLLCGYMLASLYYDVMFLKIGARFSFATAIVAVVIAFQFLFQMGNFSTFLSAITLWVIEVFIVGSLIFGAVFVTRGKVLGAGDVFFLTAICSLSIFRPGTLTLIVVLAFIFQAVFSLGIVMLSQQKPDGILPCSPTTKSRQMNLPVVPSLVLATLLVSVFYTFSYIH